MQHNVDRLAQLATEQGLALLFHPFVALLVDVARYDVWSPDGDEDEREDELAHIDDDGDHRFLEVALHDKRVLPVVCSVQLSSGLAAGDEFPRSFTPLELAGRPFAELAYRRYRAPYIEMHGTATCLADVEHIEDGRVTLRDAPSDRIARATPDAAMATYARELKQHEQEQAEFRRQAAARERTAEFEVAESVRASLLAEIEATHGRLVLRVVMNDHEVVEIRENPTGEAEASQWSNRWTSWVDGVEPLDVRRHSSLGDCLRLMFAPPDRIVTLETKLSMAELEATLAGADLSEFDFVLEGDDLTFTGEVIVSSGFFQASTLAETEEWLDPIWNFHAGIEGPRWTREVYECIGSTNGVYYYIERIDEEGSMTRLGRLSVDEAIEKGMAVAVRSEYERRLLLDEDEDDEDDEDDDDDEGEELTPQSPRGPGGRSYCSGHISRPSASS